jgi:hypothetical protein
MFNISFSLPIALALRNVFFIVSKFTFMKNYPNENGAGRNYYLNKKMDIQKLSKEMILF